jgi:hypothetical protein
MVAEPRQWVDVSGAVLAWTRASLPSLANAVGIGTVRDANGQPIYPQISLHQLGGPDDRALFQFDCWASKAAGHINAWQTANLLATALDGLNRYVFVSGGAVLKGATIDERRWAPDIDSDQPRVIVDATIFATAGS